MKKLMGILFGKLFKMVRFKDAIIDRVWQILLEMKMISILNYIIKKIDNVFNLRIVRNKKGLRKKFSEKFLIEIMSNYLALRGLNFIINWS